MTLGGIGGGVEGREALSEGVYSLLDCKVRFKSNVPGIVADLEYLYGPSRVVGGFGSVVEVNLSLKSNGRYEIYCPGLSTTEYVELWELFLHFKARLIEFFWRGENKPLLLHAGVVAKNDKGVLLAGSDGSGKTPLTLGLVEHGFDYLSDEFGVLDLNRRGLRRHPGPVSVRPDSLVWQRNMFGWVTQSRPNLFEINVWDPRDQGVRKPVFPAPVGKGVVDQIPPAVILFLEPDFQNEPGIYRIDDLDVVKSKLRENADWHRKWSDPPSRKVDQALDGMFETGGVSVYGLRVGDFDKTLKMIETLLAE